MDLEKIKAVTDWQQPKNASEIRIFLSLVSYYRRFVEGLWSIVREDKASKLERAREKKWRLELP